MIKKSATRYVVDEKSNDKDRGFSWRLVVVGVKKC